ncbi:hypothetical protein DEFDS_0757 [Deferribacter desulfuricans SSM1]|uniref:Uncharacterized protein n=1 Tax=Deferribacter desulfuricans (strain DSM 14783 / JCM 11476 / NBRC 101012 / SSM1) TaxID=639282 RepID=D3PCB2_DEFDS|nr:hypothetical protein [Deferribacter desulfuricans]BAI80235.1 hypothetical protein DEFDS_0757 [Deferribacter desulfuricans SSM1]
MIYKIVILLTSFILFINVQFVFAGYIYLNTGLETLFKSYSKSEDNESKLYEGGQIDRLFLTTKYKREFLRGRLGDLKFDLNLDKYHMNYFYNEKPSFSVPFSNNNGDNTDKYNKSINGRLNLKFPKKQTEITLEYSEDKLFKTDSDVYFNSLSKIKTDIQELDGVVKSLDDYDKNKMQNYYFYKYGTINLMANYTEYKYYKGLESDTNYLKIDTIKKAGVDIKNKVGFNFEQEIKKFNLGDDDSDKKTYLFGLVDAFGFPTLLKFGDLKFDGYAKHIDENFEGSNFNSKFYQLSTTYEKNQYTLFLSYNYEYNEDKYVNDIDKYNVGTIGLDYDSKDLTYYTEIKYKKGVITSNNLDNNSYSFNNFLAIISSGLNGSGSVIIKNSGTSSVVIDLSGLIVDGNNNFNNVLILPSDQLVISYSEYIKGNAVILSGDGDDLTVYITRDTGYKYRKNEYNIKSGYYLKYFETFKSRLDIDYYFSNYDVIYNPNNRYINEDENRFNLLKLFEIRPYNLIFDKQFEYKHLNENQDKSTNWGVISKDGYFSLNKKFYLISKYNKYNYDKSNDKEYYSFTLNLDLRGSDYNISFYPEKEYEKEFGVYKKYTTTYDLKVRYKKHNLSTYYSKEEKKYNNLSTYSEKEKRVYYIYSGENILFDVKYNENIYEYKLQLFNANLKLVKYRSFPVVRPYAIFEIGFERERDNAIGEYEKDDYVIVKLTYTPTDRLRAIFSFEKQIDRNMDKGYDYECGVNYQTRVFKLALGYRKNITEIDEKRRVEHEVYFELRKNFDFYYGTGS